MRFLFFCLFFANCFWASAQYSYADLVKTGDNYVAENRLDSAEKQYYKALAVQEGAEAYYGLGYILSVKCHDFGVSCDDAIRYLLKSRELDSTYRSQDFNLSVCYLKKNNYAEALKYANYAVTKNPADRESYLQRAAVKGAMGDKKGYNKDMKTAEKMLKKKK